MPLCVSEKLANSFKPKCKIELDQVPWIAVATFNRERKEMRGVQRERENSSQNNKPDLTSLCNVENHCIEIVLLHTRTALQLAKVLERVQRGLLVVDEDELVRLGGRRRHRRNRRNGRRRERVGLARQRGLRRVCHLRRGPCSLCSHSRLCWRCGSLGCLAHAVRHSPQKKQGGKKRKAKRRCVPYHLSQSAIESACV